MKEKIMAKAQQDGELRIIFGLALFGLIVSGYLSADHYNTADSVCDISDAVSCSIINKGDFSSIASVPIAVWGVCWFASLFVIAWNVSRHNEHFALWVWTLTAWCASGIVFVVYLVGVEIYLRSICPVCTLIHIITLIVSWLAYRLYGRLKTVPAFSEVVVSLKWWVLTAGLLFLIPFVCFNVVLTTEVHAPLERHFRLEL
eukprot:TRINITY_DN2974_c0_g1_i3.p2 TRINITY_DN2974_c0_g1~~TRINITY_DN2974_c0_g1_i3.p2  ORF type:complete len:201 (-),score=26.85 TRINITY_DN2974_c0_g1_i3:322-924(-)